MVEIPDGQIGSEPESSLPQHELISSSSIVDRELLDNRGLRFELADVFKDTPFEQLLTEGRISDATDGIQSVLKTEAEVKVTFPDGTSSNITLKGEKVRGTIYIDGQKYSIQDYRNRLGSNISQNDLLNLAAFEQAGITEVVVTRNGRLARFNSSKDSVYVTKNTGKK